jgi:tetratricopeptide (TPR) repeat protein
MRSMLILLVLALAGVGAWIWLSRGDASSSPTAQQASKLSEADTKLRLGLQMYQAGRFQESIGLFEQTLALDPQNHEAQFNRASALAQLQRNDEALREFDRMLAEPTHQNDPAVLANRAITLNQLGRSTEALDNIDRALAVANTEAPWHIVRAETLLALGRHEESLQSAERAKSLRPDLAQIELIRAQDLAALGKAAEADAIYEELLKKFPTDLALRKKVGELRGK